MLTVSEGILQVICDKVQIQNKAKWQINQTIPFEFKKENKRTFRCKQTHHSIQANRVVQTRR